MENGCNPALHFEQASVRVHRHRSQPCRRRFTQTPCHDEELRLHEKFITPLVVSCSTHSRNITCSLVAKKDLYNNLRVQLRTRCRYKDAVTAFSTWLRDKGQYPSPDKDGLDAQLCEYLELLWHEGAHVGGCQFFLQKKRYFPAAWEVLRTWKREEPPWQAPPLTGPIVFALIATALALNLTDVAVLVAIGYGDFLMTMEALTLQRHQITAHGTCILVTLPITKTSKRTGEIQSVIYDDFMLVSIITRLLCLLCPSDHLLQRSSDSFRAIFAWLAPCVGTQFVSLHSVKFEKRWSNCPLDVVS